MVSSARTWRAMASGSCPTNKCSYASKPSIASPDPTPVTPSSVSTRTIVTGKVRRGSGSQAAANGGSSGTTRRCSRTALIRTTAVSPTTPRGRGAVRLRYCDACPANKDPRLSTARDRPPEEAAEDTSFARGLRVFLTIADRGEIRADELSTLLETPLSTVYRYLRTLTEFGFVERLEGGYRLGPRLHLSGGATVSSEELIRHADPVLRMLVAEAGETAVISRRVGLSAVSLHEVQSTHALRVTSEPGSATALVAGAIAKVLLAYAPADIQDEVLAGA